MPQAKLPVEDLSNTELLHEIAGNLRYLRRLLSEYEPLLSAIRGNGNGDVVRITGLRRAMKRGARDAATPGHR